MSHILPLQLPITKFNKKTERLILGYIRSIEITKWIIPSAIVELCITYYHSKLIIICFSDRIKVAELDSNKYYNTTISPLDESINPLKFAGGVMHSNYHCRVSYIEEFKLPSNVLRMNKQFNDNNVYSAIFHINDSYWSHSSTNAYIIDINANDKYKIYNDEFIDIYNWPLPKCNNDIMGSYPLYSTKHGLVLIGNMLSTLPFNDYVMDKWQWESVNIPQFVCNLGSAVFIDDDRFIYCGGRSSNMCNIYDFNLLKWFNMSDMKNGRHYCGICFDNNKVFVGGGVSGVKGSFDYLDLKQNKWNGLCCSNKRHAYNPIIWIEDVNMIHIASSSSRVFEKMDLRENKWTIYIDKKQFETMFGTPYKVYSRLCM